MSAETDERGEGTEAPTTPGLEQARRQDADSFGAGLHRLETSPSATERTEPTGEGREATETGGTGHRDRPLTEFHQNYPHEYVEPPAHEPVAIEPAGHPQELVEGVNPRYGEGPEWQTNCVDCSRAVERRWRGQQEEASGRSEKVGEDPAQLEEWAGQELAPTSEDDIVARLQEAGPGSSAIVVASWEADDLPDGMEPVDQDRPCHAFNAVNHDGTVYYVDGQTGEYSPWPPTTNDPYFAGRTFETVEAVGWDEEGEPLWP